MAKLNILSRIMSVEAVRRQSIISFIWSVVYTVVGFISTVYFTRVVGEDVLGAYFLFVAYFGVIAVFSDGGFTGAAQKRISEGEQENEYFTSFFVMRSSLMIVVILSLIALRPYFVDLDNAGAFTWIIIGLIVSIFQVAIHCGIGGRGKIGVYSTSQFINNVSRIFVQIVAVYLGFGVAGLAGGFVAGIIIAAIIELRFFDLRFVRFGMQHVKSLASFSFWTFLSASGKQVFAYTDTIVIGFYLSNADVGVYNIVFHFIGIMAFTTTAIRLTLWPKISLWGKIGEMGPVERSLTKAFTYSLILAVPMLAGGILLGDKLLYFIYGPAYSQYTVLVLLLIAELINIFSNMFVTYLSSLNYIKDSFRVTIIGASANVVLNLLLIPLIGIEGAALATLLTIAFNAFLGRRILSGKINIHVERSSLLNIVKASALMSIFVLAYRLVVPLSNVWLTLLPVFIGGILYAFLILKFDKDIHDELKTILVQMNLA